MKWYIYNIRDLNNEEYHKWYALMSEDKQRRVNKFKFEEDKKRAVAGEMLARKSIAELCNVAVESIVFGKSEYGKPFVRDLNVEFNISHSGDMVACVVDDKQVGIDIEKIRPIDLDVIKSICTEEEKVYILGDYPIKRDFKYITDTKILSRFFEVWTRKEAYFKCIGGRISNFDSLQRVNLSYDTKQFNFKNYTLAIVRKKI